MTSAPVRNVDALMNFVGGKNLTQTSGTNQTSSFGDVMGKAQNGETSAASKKQQVPKGKANDMIAKDSHSSHRDTVKTKDVSETAKQSRISDTQKDKVEETGKELVENIAKELGVSEEDVVRAMEELGLSIYSLFDQANLTQLVLNVTDQQDASALLVDEGLFDQVQSLMETATEMLNGLAQELDVNPEEMQMIMEKLMRESMEQEALSEDSYQISQETTAEVIGAEEVQVEAGPITVEVSINGETVKLATDENGNVDKTLEVVPQESKETKAEKQISTGEQKSSKEGKDQSEKNGQSTNSMLDALLQNKTPIQETANVEQADAFFSSQTQDIMDQIMDYMKIQLKPGMDQLEMQLHPASLGTVNVQLTSKGGEVTAQFQVQNETVKAVIESQIVELKESLRDQGVKVEAVQVTVENHGFESNLWQGQGREENASSQGGRKSPRRINLNDLDALSLEEASEEEVLAAKMMEANGNTVDYTA